MTNYTLTQSQPNLAAIAGKSGRFTSKNADNSQIKGDIKRIDFASKSSNNQNERAAAVNQS